MFKNRYFIALILRFCGYGNEQPTSEIIPIRDTWMMVDDEHTQLGAFTNY